MEYKSTFDLITLLLILPHTHNQQLQFTITMRVFAVFSALAAAGFATAQEAARFGSVNVSPCGFTGGDAITITYNATTAIQHDNVPQSVGLWIQGINVTDGIRTTTTPFFRLAHNDSLNAQADPIFTAQLTLPEIFATFTTQSWQVTSFIIYGNDVLTEFGGTTDTCPQTN
ncbi:hypothetical protein D9758_004647 [Tetrapyrgos nigripes]|uniref:Uncharacterized protein n=1 Tax=Tetrapyrgos nigripes TaxID=182062 RepID=A0A8H5LYH2_9AGAR|nr:hypothetical protein D9758_004647 [Tetrapyrgos nigripes]